MYSQLNNNYKTTQSAVYRASILPPTMFIFISRSYLSSWHCFVDASFPPLAVHDLIPLAFLMIAIHLLFPHDYNSSTFLMIIIHQLWLWRNLSYISKESTFIFDWLPFEELMHTLLSLFTHPRILILIFHLDLVGAGAAPCVPCAISMGKLSFVAWINLSAQRIWKVWIMIQIVVKKLIIAPNIARVHLRIQYLRIQNTSKCIINCQCNI